MMVTCFKDPAAVFRKVFESCTPGGYFEIQDMALPLRWVDDTLFGTSLLRHDELYLDGAKALGKDLIFT